MNRYGIHGISLFLPFRTMRRKAAMTKERRSPSARKPVICRTSAVLPQARTTMPSPYPMDSFVRKEMNNKAAPGMKPARRACKGLPVRKDKTKPGNRKSRLNQIRIFFSFRSVREFPPSRSRTSWPSSGSTGARPGAISISWRATASACWPRARPAYGRPAGRPYRISSVR